MRPVFRCSFAVTNRLLVSCSSLGSNRVPRTMTRLPIAILTLIAIATGQLLRAQEAISSTGSSSTGTENAPSSAAATTDLSTGSSSASSPQAVSSAPSAADSVQGGPSGTGVFSPTPIKIYLNVAGGYDNNVNTNVGTKQGSEFASGNVILDYTFGDPRLQIALNAGAGGVYYFENVATQEYDVDLKGAVGITYKSSPRLTLGTTLLVEYLTEPNFDNPSGLNSRNGNYFYTSDNFFAQYVWSRRFSTKTFYALQAYQYDNNAVALFSDHSSHMFGNEFQFQMVPTTKLIAEYRYGIVSYDNDGAVIIPATLFAPAVLLRNDSTAHFLLAGLDHVFNPRFSGSFRGGAEFRSYDSGGDRAGPYFEGTLNYAVGKRTSVSWSNRYGIEEPEVSGAQSRTTFRTGLHGKVDLASRVSSTLDAYYAHNEYHSLTKGPSPVPAFSEDSFDIGLAIRYAVTPLIGVQVGYHYTNIVSDLAFREYSRNRVSGGISVTF